VISLVIYLFLQRQRSIARSPTPTPTPTPTPPLTPSSTPTSTPSPTPTPTPTPSPSYPSNYAQYLCSQGYFDNGICIYQQQIFITNSPPQPGNGTYVFQNQANVPICVGAFQAVGSMTISCFPNCSQSCGSPSCMVSNLYPLGCIPPNSYGYYVQLPGSSITQFYLIYEGAIYAGYPAQAHQNYIIPLPPLPSSFQQGSITNNTGRSIFIQVTNSSLNNIWSIAIDNNVTVPLWYDNNTVFTICYYETTTCQQFSMPSSGQLVVTNIS
jgi:hypothetical protein